MANRLSRLVRQGAVLRDLREDDETWERFIESSGSASPLQSIAWAEAKAYAGWSAERIVVEAGSGPIGAQVLVRRLGPGPFGIGYIPHGPVATSLDLRSLTAFSDAVREVAERCRLTHVTAEPALEDGDAARLFAATGWRTSDPVQPPSTRLIELDRSEQSLWSDLYSSTRRHINRARKAGCTVREGDGSDIRILHAIVEETAGRAGFIPRPFEAYLHAYRVFSRAGKALLLIGSLPDGSIVSAKLILLSGPRASQVYGGISDRGFEERAGHFFEWEAIIRSRALGSRTFDMWGHPTPGIAYFKQGFGGRVVCHTGAWDLVRVPLLHGLVLHRRRSSRWIAGRLVTRGQGG